MGQLPQSHLSPAALTNRRETAFEMVPTAAERAAIAQALNIPDVKKLRFNGQLTPQGGKDWVLKASLGATIVQACVITLDPVTTRIDETITRTYLAQLPEIDASELEMPEDDSIELLPETIDIGAVMLEALTLALPQYPRSDGANLGNAVFTQPGAAAMTDEDARPFAGLGALRDVLKNKDE